MTVDLRPIRPEDRGFVASTWTRSFANFAPWASQRATRDRHGAVIDTILAAPETRTVMLCSGDQGRTLHGYACARGPVLHYVYVPPELRGHGLGRRVITAALGSYPDAVATSHPWPRPSPRFRWDAYALFFAGLPLAEPFRIAA